MGSYADGQRPWPDPKAQGSGPLSFDGAPRWGSAKLEKTPTLWRPMGPRGGGGRQPSGRKAAQRGEAEASSTSPRSSHPELLPCLFVGVGPGCAEPLWRARMVAEPTRLLYRYPPRLAEINFQGLGITVQPRGPGFLGPPGFGLHPGGQPRGPGFPGTPGLKISYRFIRGGGQPRGPGFLGPPGRGRFCEGRRVENVFTPCSLAYWGT